MDNFLQGLNLLGGSIEYSAHITISKSHSLFLIFTNKTKPALTHSLLIQHLPVTCHKSSIYIQSIDTTGMFHPRHLQRQFTKAFIIAGINFYKAKNITCFSHPKDVIIFGNSNKSGLKGSLSAGRLLHFWKDIIKMSGYELFVYSNYAGEKRLPFKRLQDIVLYEDDPKRKAIEEGINNIGDLVEILQFRKDFVKGSLIFGKKNEGIKDFMINETGDVNRMVEMLRSLDFSTKDKVQESTKVFIDEYNLFLEWSMTGNHDILIEEVVKVDVVKRPLPRNLL